MPEDDRVNEPSLRTVWGLSFAHFVTDLYSPVLPALLPFLVLNQEYSYLLAGLLVTAYNLTSSTTQPIFGWFFDRTGRGIPVSSSLLLSAVFIALLGVARYYPVLLIFAILAALGHATFHPRALARVGGECNDRNRGRLMSYFVIGGNLGYAVGPLLVGAALGWMGLPGLLLFLLPGTLTALALRILAPPGQEPPPARTTLPVRTTISLGPVFILVLGAALRAWVIFATIAFVPSLLIEQGVPLVLANTLVTGMLLAGVVGQVVGGTLSDLYGRKEYTIAGMLLSLPFLLLFLTSEGFMAVLWLLLFGLTLWSTFAVTVAIGQEMMPHHVGLASGLVLGLAVGGGGVGVAITGAIADATSLSTALILLPLPILAAIVCFAILPYPWKQRPFRRE